MANELERLDAFSDAVHHSLAAAEINSMKRTRNSIIDHYAGHALTGLLVNKKLDNATELLSMCDNAFKLAEAMLQARDRYLGTEAKPDDELETIMFAGGE